MVKRKLSFISLFIGMAVVLLFFFITPSAEVMEEPEPSIINLTDKNLTDYIERYNFLILDIKKELHKNEFPVVLDYSISSNGKIDLIIKTNQENNKKTVGKITEIVSEIIKQNNFDLNSFQIDIDNYYEPQKDMNKTSVRLSYNDLIGYIGESLFSKYNIAFSLEYEVSLEIVKLKLNLPTNQTDKNVEIEQIVFDTIRQYNFDSNLFQVDISNNLKID